MRPCARRCTGLSPHSDSALQARTGLTIGRMLSFLLGAAATLAEAFAAAAPRPAVRFDWSTVPVFFHADNFTGDWNNESLLQLAKYPIVTIEKWMGSLAACKADGWSPCCGAGGGADEVGETAVCEEDRIISNFARLKAINKNVSTVLYLNSVLNFPQYRLAQQMQSHPEYWLRDASGKVIGMYGDAGPPNMTVFDFSQPAVREIFVGACVDAIKTGHVDGCFIDRAVDGFPTNLDPAKQAAYDAGHLQVLHEMQRQISEISGGPLIANHAYNLSGINSVQIENFGRDVQTGWQGWNTSMAQLKESVASGKLVEAHIPCAKGTMDGCTGDITDTLAAFLVVAGHQSYCKRCVLDCVGLRVSF
jgi:hypothetical protein